MPANQLRKAYLDFFIKRGHKKIPSDPLILKDDPSTLFTSAGMQPLIPYLLGKAHPKGKRLVNSQKCFRSQDIAEVGDNRHTTFYEMLGNWSFGDYFKKEQLSWLFTFLVETLGLLPEKLYVTVFAGDDVVPKDTESIAIWEKLFKSVGIDAREGERIFAYGATKNWWSRAGEPEKMPAGEPGGPDSEVFFDFGTPHNSKFGKTCHPNCDCGRFFEIANTVFMQYQKQGDGSIVELQQKNVDFGGGLERMVAASMNEPDVFKTDLFFPLIQILEKESGKLYKDSLSQASMRVIVDHLKAATFMTSEGLIPGNKDQAYVLRRLIRRSVVKMHQLDIKSSLIEVTKKICKSVGEMYKDFYTDLDPQSSKFLPVTIVIGEEIDKFERVLHKGLQMLEKQQKIDGEVAFDLHQSYGFPWELTLELAAERGHSIDREEIKKEFAKHQEVSRLGAKKHFTLEKTLGKQ